MLLRRERSTDTDAIATVHHRAFDALGIYDGPPVEDRLVESWGEHFQVRPLASYGGQTGTFRYAAPFDAF